MPIRNDWSRDCSRVAHGTSRCTASRNLMRIPSLAARRFIRSRRQSGHDVGILTSPLGRRPTSNHSSGRRRLTSSFTMRVSRLCAIITKTTFLARAPKSVRSGESGNCIRKERAKDPFPRGLFPRRKTRKEAADGECRIRTGHHRLYHPANRPSALKTRVKLGWQRVAVSVG